VDSPSPLNLLPSVHLAFLVSSLTSSLRSHVLRAHQDDLVILQPRRTAFCAHLGPFNPLVLLRFVASAPQARLRLDSIKALVSRVVKVLSLREFNLRHVPTALPESSLKLLVHLVVLTVPLEPSRPLLATPNAKAVQLAFFLILLVSQYVLNVHQVDFKICLDSHFAPVALWVRLQAV